MANLQVNHHHISISISRRLFSGTRNNHPLRKSTVLIKHRTRWKRDNHNHSLTLVPRSVGEGGSALVQQRPPNEDEDELPNVIDQMAEVGTSGDVDDGGKGEEESFDGYLVRECGWKVRRMVEDKSEIRKVARVQAQAFHVPAFFFDDIFFHFFQAEVLAGLHYRLRNSPPDRYACLVAEVAERDNTSSTNPQELDLHHQQQQQLVGVVDVTVLRDDDVLPHLQGVQEYLYVSGIAVSHYFRRQKVATVLLKACEVISVLWGYEYLVLRAYEDDQGAQALYTNAGYRVVARDPPWVTWIGRKTRVLMIKRLW